MSDENVGGLPPLPEWCLDDDRAAYVLAGMSGPQYRNDMQDYARAALSAHGQPVVDEWAMLETALAAYSRADYQWTKRGKDDRDEPRHLFAMKAAITALTGATP